MARDYANYYFLGELMQVIFTSSDLPLALAVRFFTGCRWSHCGVVYNGSSVIEASALHGVRAVSLNDFKARGKYCIVDFEVRDEHAAMHFLYNQLGKPYDWTGAIAYPFRGDWQEATKWYCSEIVAASLSAGGVDLFRDGIRSITPRDLYINNVGKLIYESL